MKCIKDRCYSPVACGGWGYCRELNMLPREMRSALTKIAAECHRSKWQFSDEKDPRAFNELHRIGDMVLEMLKSKVEA